MKNKKSKKANLEKSRTVFMLIGLIIAIAFVVSAFQWQSEKVMPIMKKEEVRIDDGVFTISTKNDYIERIDKKVEQDIKNDSKIITDQLIISNSAKQRTDVTIEAQKIPKNVIIEQIPEENIDSIYVFTSEPPIFEKGGISGLRKWIGKNVNYPAIARENSIQGTVYLRFEVTKTGHIGKVEMQKGVDPLIDEEAINVIKKLPKFKPGKHNGAEVNVWYSIPISFKLN